MNGPTPRTARALAAAVTPCGPRPRGAGLDFDSPPPAVLWPALDALHTGVRAVLTGRRWWGCDGHGTGRGSPLSVDAPVPAWVSLLTVEGDAVWDRIAPSARLDHPHLFEPPARDRRADVAADPTSPTPPPAGYTPPSEDPR